MATPKEVLKNDAETLDKKDQETELDTQATPTSLTLVGLNELPEHRQIEAFRLLTDAQAQRRNLSNRVMYSSGTFFGVYILLASFIIYKIRQRSIQNDMIMEWGTLLLSLSGLAMALISLASRYTDDAIKKAEKMNIDEIFGADKDVLTFIYNEIVVGVVSVRRTSGDRDGKQLLQKAAKKLAEKRSTMTQEELEKYEKIESAKVDVLPIVADDTALVAGWSVLKKYRGIGMGKDLLDKAEDIARTKFHAKKLVVITESIEASANAVLAKKGYKKTKSTVVKGLRGSWFKISEFVWTKNLTKKLDGKK